MTKTSLINFDVIFVKYPPFFWSLGIRRFFSFLNDQQKLTNSIVTNGSHLGYRGFNVHTDELLKEKEGNALRISSSDPSRTRNIGSGFPIERVFRSFTKVYIIAELFSLLSRWCGNIMEMRLVNYLLQGRCLCYTMYLDKILVGSSELYISVSFWFMATIV